MMLNPYETAIGQHTNSKRLQYDLEKYIIKAGRNHNLNYEYSNTDTVELFFITGKNEDEMELPVWNHPLLVKTNTVNKIFVDVRTMVRLKEAGDFTDLSTVVNNKAAFDFTIIRTIFMMLSISNYGEVTTVTNTTALAFAKWVSTSIKTVLTLGIEETIDLEIIALHYAYCITSNEEYDDRTIENIYFKITKNLKVVRNNLKYVAELCKGLNNNPCDAVDLVENISTKVQSPLLTNFNTNVLYNILGNTWNGISAYENIVMSIEHVPTLIAIFAVSLDNKSFKHSKLANILNNNKRVINADEFVKKVNLIVEDTKM